MSAVCNERLTILSMGLVKKFAKSKTFVIQLDPIRRRHFNKYSKLSCRPMHSSVETKNSHTQRNCKVTVGVSRQYGAHGTNDRSSSQHGGQTNWRNRAAASGAVVSGASLLAAWAYWRKKEEVCTSSSDYSSETEHLLKQLHQKDFVKFEDVGILKTTKSVEKIGEGSQGDVYRLANEGQTTILKVIPIGGELSEQGFPEIITELKITDALGYLLSWKATENLIVPFKSLLVIGGYHPKLVDAWERFEQESSESEKLRPTSYSLDQLYLVYECEDGGDTLEDLEALPSLDQIGSILRQLCWTLAVLEYRMEFEHRDLHFGNILVKPSSDKCRHSARACYQFDKKGPKYCFDCHGIRVKIIDYAFARMTHPKTGEILYNDLSASSMSRFNRSMIFRLLQARNQKDWSSYDPYSNILWIQYVTATLLSRLIQADDAESDGREEPGSKNVEGSKISRQRSAQDNNSESNDALMKELWTFLKEIPIHQNALDLVFNSAFLQADLDSRTDWIHFCHGWRIEGM